MRKKLITLLLLIPVLVLLASTALAASTTIEVKPPTGSVASGSSFSVEVNLTGNPGISSIQFTLGFESDKMQCVDVEIGSLLNGMLSASNSEADGGAKIAAAAASNRNGDGTLATFLFKALTDISKVDFTLLDVSLSTESGETVSFVVSGAELKTTPTHTPDISPAPTSSPSPTPSQTQPQMPASPQTPSDTETPTETSPVGNSEAAPLFTDTADHWGEEYIAKAVSKSLFFGYPDGSFRPDAPITRAQYMAVLYRAAGSPLVDTKTSFQDIGGQSEEFQEAIAWGYANGYIDGRSESVFDPDGALTRQEAMKILFYRAGGISGTEMMLKGIYDNQFPDSDEIASWAKPAMYWAIYHEIISGSDIGLEPGANTTRAQMSKILVNYLEQNE